MKHWQDRMLDDLISYFEQDEDVLGALLFGSLSKLEFHPDEWSDIDLLLVVKEGKIAEYFPSVAWLTPFGQLYTYNQSTDDFSYTTRVCFENFNRIDLVITTGANLAEINKWPSILFSSGVKVLLSRSKIVDEIAGQQFIQKQSSPASQEQFLMLVRSFRFKSMLAVNKVVRNDLLIALHLAQDLVRDCCVLAMMLRDRATGTNIHKEGGIGNQVVPQLEITQQPFTPTGILDSVKASHEVFEKLALEWSGRYQENRQLLFNWIEKAKDEIHM